MKKYLGLFFTLFFLFWAGSVSARDYQNITDWYIKNLETSIVVNKDSSLLIIENITADCGNLPDKHGIFRVLPTEIKTDKGIFKTPIELISITNFDGNPYDYQTIKNNFDKTITWKIGDPDRAVTGENYYKIIYRVKNAVRFINSDFDELYWNLLGTSWQIDIDNFSAEITFPSEINQQNTVIDYYTGSFGSKDKSLAKYSWSGDNSLYFSSTTSLLAGQGITLSAVFPKNIFTAYQPTFWDRYGEYFWYLFFLLPIAVFGFVFRMWKKYGKDPKMSRLAGSRYGGKIPISPEFGIPENITPAQMGMVITSGVWRDKFITAIIIDLAVRGFVTIEEFQKEGIILKHKEIRLTKKTENYDVNKLTDTEKVLLESLFSEGKDSVELSELKEDKFYMKVSDIKKSAKDDVINRFWIVEQGLLYSVIFISSGLFCGFFSIMAIVTTQNIPLFLSLILTAIILLIFGIIMPKRTQTGVDLLFKIKGFELYMKQAENYRQQFYEKENIFDKFLPYAIIFGIAGLWVKKMQLIYGEAYFNNYHPAWFIGTNHFNFDADSFTNQLNSITQSISSNTSSSSGAGGSGGAGGGGGGGGGGGW